MFRTCAGRRNAAVVPCRRFGRSAWARPRPRPQSRSTAAFHPRRAERAGREGRKRAPAGSDRTLRTPRRPLLACHRSCRRPADLLRWIQESQDRCSGPTRRRGLGRQGGDRVGLPTDLSDRHLRTTERERQHDGAGHGRPAQREVAEATVEDALCAVCGRACGRDAARSGGNSAGAGLGHGDDVVIDRWRDGQDDDGSRLASVDDGFSRHRRRRDLTYSLKGSPEGVRVALGSVDHLGARDRGGGARHTGDLGDRRAQFLQDL